MNFAGYTDDMMTRWLWLRAVEWGNFPSYISTPIAPILLIFYPWYFVVLGIIALSCVWSLVRYSFVSVRLAGAATVFHICLKWPAAIGSSIYLFIHHRPVVGVLALIWPIVAGLLGGPVKIGIIQSALAKRIGFVLPDAKL
jgi:hypothetical protein